MKKFLASIFAISLLAGCAHNGPKLSSIRESIPALASGKGRIYFYRNSSWFGGALSPDIRLNGKAVGSAKPGSVFFVDSDPGQYKVEITTEKTNETEFPLTAGETKYIRFEVSMGVLVAHLSPEVVPPHEAEAEVENLSYSGPENAVRVPASTNPAPSAR